MKEDIDFIWQALSLHYGSQLQAATVTLLLRDGEAAVRFLTIAIPQKETEK